MSFFSDLIQNWAKTQGVKAFGPGWEEKLAKMQAETKNLGYEGQHIQAETAGTQARTKETGVKTAGEEDALKEIIEKRAKRQKLVESGYIPDAETPDIAAHIAVEKEKEATKQNDVNTPGSEAALRRAHAGYFNRMPKDTSGAGGGNPNMGSYTPLMIGGKTMLVNAKLYAASGGTQGVIGEIGGNPIAKLPNESELQKTSDLDEAVRGARTLENMFASGNLHQGVRGKVGQVLKNVPVASQLLNSPSDLEADRQMTSTLLSRVYALSGKQINEQEFKRLLSLLPNRANQKEVNKVNASAFRTEMERIAGRWQKLVTAGMSEAQAAEAVKNDAGPQQPTQPGAGDINHELDTLFPRQQ